MTDNSGARGKHALGPDPKEVLFAKRPILSDLLLVIGVSAVVGTFLTAITLLQAARLHWGGFAWLVAFYVMSAIRAPHVIRNAGNTIAETRGGWADRALLAGMGLTGVALPFIALATSWLSLADYAMPDWATATGVVLAVAALALLWRAHFDLGINWSPSLELRRDHGLVVLGVYHYVRHPIYVSIWLWSLAQPLLVHNWLGGAAILPAFALLYFVRVPREEAMMRDRFGATYDAYCARTGRLLPKLIRIES